MTCIVTLFNGKEEFPILGLKENDQVDLSEYKCNCIQQKDLPYLQHLLRYPLLCEKVSLLVEILEQGLEIHLWVKNRHK